MTHRQLESLDETIDRVAARLTMVPADPALAGRIAAQLETRPAIMCPRFALATAAVAAAVVLTIVMSQTPGDVPSDAAARVDAPTPSRPLPAIGSSARVTHEIRPRPAAARQVRQSEDALPAFPQIDALTAPALLGVDSIPTDTLAIESVPLAPLDLPDLAVSALGDGEDRKE